MTASLLRRSLLIALVIAAGRASALRGQSLEAAVANDNRKPAGRLHEGGLSLSLEIRRGVWHPEGENGEALPIYAFAEAGKPLQVPAPLIRVPQGTTVGKPVHWRVINASDLSHPMHLHGLHFNHGPGRRSGRDVGETYDFEYAATEPGQLTLEGIQPNDTRRAVQTLVFTGPGR